MLFKRFPDDFQDKLYPVIAFRVSSCQPPQHIYCIGPGQGPQRGHINNVSLAENRLLTALTVPINLQFSNSFRVTLKFSRMSIFAAEIRITVSVGEGLQASLNLPFFL